MDTAIPSLLEQHALLGTSPTYQSLAKPLLETFQTVYTEEIERNGITADSLADLLLNDSPSVPWLRLRDEARKTFAMKAIETTENRLNKTIQTIDYKLPNAVATLDSALDRWKNSSLPDEAQLHPYLEHYALNATAATSYEELQFLLAMRMDTADIIHHNVNEEPFPDLSLKTEMSLRERIPENRRLNGLASLCAQDANNAAAFMNRSYAIFKQYDAITEQANQTIIENARKALILHSLQRGMEGYS